MVVGVVAVVVVVVGVVVVIVVGVVGAVMVGGGVGVVVAVGGLGNGVFQCAKVRDPFRISLLDKQEWRGYHHAYPLGSKGTYNLMTAMSWLGQTKQDEVAIVDGRLYPRSSGFRK